MKFGYEGGAEADHDRAQDDGAEDTPEQDAVLILPRYGEVGEDEGDDEDIVEGEAFFDNEASDIFDACLGSQLCPDETAEAQTHGNVDSRQSEALAHAYFVIVPVQDAEIERQQGDDDADEAEPHPERLTQEKCTD